MKWKPGRRSRNLEDRRGERARRRVRLPRFPGLGGGRVGGGRVGGGRLPLPRSKGGLLTLVLILGAAWYLGLDPTALLGGGTGVQVPQGPMAGRAPVGPAGGGTPPVSSPAEERLVDFVSFVLDDAQRTWARLLPGYRDARLVLFRDVVQSACGGAQAAMGPFYCPGDQKVYIDLAFYEELQRRFGAPGDFAQAYVLAHEIGHHVQNIAGTERRVRQAQRRNPALANDLSVRMELQADCYAGVWAHSTERRELLEAGDVEEALGAASAVGDDAIQRMSGRAVRRESFTHGSSRERTTWFRRGLESGDPNRCDTFSS